MKRIFDLILAIFILVVLSPLFLFIGLLIKISSKGPVIFCQKRIGLNKKEFFIYKFRTMYIEAPKDVPTHLLEDTQKHITPLGKILRATSLDELPQLINIIYGEMSFVGPRPALYNQYDLIKLRDQYNVHSIKPGITGWAQINGRDELLIEEKAKLDKYYLDNYSFSLDLKIFNYTIVNIIRKQGIIEGNQNK